MAYLPFYPKLPRWIKVAGTVIGFALAVVGVGGVPDDARTWYGWFGTVLLGLDGEALRWIATISGFAVLFYLYAWPRLYFRYYLRSKWGIDRRFRNISVIREGDWSAFSLDDVEPGLLRIVALDVIIANDNDDQKILEVKILVKRRGEPFEPPFFAFTPAAVLRQVTHNEAQLPNLLTPITLPARDTRRGCLQFTMEKHAIMNLGYEHEAFPDETHMNCALQTTVRPGGWSRIHSYFILRIPNDMLPRHEVSA